MQLLPILLVAAVLAVDGGLRPPGPDWGLQNGLIALLACGPIALIVLVTIAGMNWCERKLNAGRFPRPLLAAERFGRYARTLILLAHLAAVLVFGWVGTVRSFTGNLILVDEVVAITPALLGWLGVWWAYYPIEKRLHQATLIRQLDEGHAVYPTLSRWRYVMLQARMHLLLLLVPVLMIAGISEMIARAGELEAIPQNMMWTLDVARFAAAAGVFMMAPLLARVMLDVRPVPAGELREMLTEVCRRHRVRVRELLIWNTNGSMFNAAVMGLMGRLRYVLLTDALLETMPEQQVRAVMAHEIGHVRRHHMLWMILCLLACFVLALYVFRLPLYLELIPLQQMHQWMQIALAIGELTLALTLFGWVSRRFERQADTFAVQHLSDQPIVTQTAQETAESAAATQDMRMLVRGYITPEAVQAMCGALDFIGRLNAIDMHRRSWRHGSIAWRMSYLTSLIGKPIHNIRIDRIVRRIQWIAAILLIGSILHLLAEYLYIQSALEVTS